jgi:F-type H+-transporting ATPase subunit gamma
MPSLKDLRVRIKSVRNTRKITSAMKMVAASKLKRAQDQAEAARPYAERMDKMLASLAASVAGTPGAPKLLGGTGDDKVHLVVVMTSDRGLCGAFNSSVVRGARTFLRGLVAQGKTIKIMCVGRKGRDQLRGEFGRFIVKTVDSVGKKLTFANGVAVADEIRRMLDAGEFDVCALIYNRFKSAISQVLTTQQLIPLTLPVAETATGGAQATYEFEPDETAILDEILPLNLAVQTYRALLESYAGENGARMAAMDNATRNAGDMINRLTLNYNRTRQAVITKEMIEIVSGAEAI